MSLRGKIKEIDNRVKQVIDDKSKTSFILNLTFQALSKILLGFIIVTCTFLGNIIANETIGIQTEKEKISNIKLGVGKDYISSHLGTPIIDSNKNGYNDCYFELNHIVVHAIFDESDLIAYFITLTDNKIKLDLKHENENFKLGKSNYDEIVHPRPEISMNYSYDHTGIYYAEKYGRGRYGNYNSCVYAILPYGYLRDVEVQYIIDVHGANISDKDVNYVLSGDNETPYIFIGNSASDKIMDTKRNIVLPNTFGVIEDGYEDKVNVIYSGEDSRDYFNILWKGEYERLPE